MVGCIASGYVWVVEKSDLPVRQKPAGEGDFVL